MCGLRIYLLCLVVASCILFGVSHCTNESVCVLSNAPQQCGAFCLAQLHPLCDQYAKSKQKEKIVKMIEDSRAEQKELVKSQEAMAKLIAESRAEQNELLNVLAANLTATAIRLESTVKSIPIVVPPGFEKFGYRYLFIEYDEKKSWADAEATCWRKGGNLAAFRNEDELEAVRKAFNPLDVFWLGYQRNSKGVFQTAAGNKRPFMKWESGQPDNLGGQQNCVALIHSLMYDMQCDDANHFICELDLV
ncbi:accessory gland protein Acp29AB [Drosophila yakuba]|uniref:C-type lectin domain-containing protein n=1 Tax=Drosophila yakuba TaxID=7245 RepID=A0A0R1DIY6_DROYA|nr:accessory gland protein Acp29AB [Drosophila yakuba]KRJ97096.1 uncharacterized protein Dyak_GE27972 [Drosophila yakuba]